MTAAHRCIRALTATALLSTLAFATACDVDADSPDADLELVEDEQPVTFAHTPVNIDGRKLTTSAEMAAESAKFLSPEGGPETIPVFCDFEQFKFRTTVNTVALTGAPGLLLPPSPEGIPTFDDPALADGFISVVTLEDLNDNVVGFASEQEILDLANLEADTTYTLTLPGRGTLMLKQRESSEILFDTVNDIILDGETQRTFNPPIEEVLTLPHTGWVVGGAGEFSHDFGIWQEVGRIHGVDLVNNTFDLEVVLEILHC